MTVPMVGLTACQTSVDLHPNDDDGIPLQAVCMLPTGHHGAHWARVEAWSGEPHVWMTVDIPEQRRPGSTDRRS